MAISFAYIWLYRAVLTLSWIQDESLLLSFSFSSLKGGVWRHNSWSRRRVKSQTRVKTVRTKPFGTLGFHPLQMDVKYNFFVKPSLFRATLLVLLFHGFSEWHTCTCISFTSSFLQFCHFTMYMSTFTCISIFSLLFFFFPRAYTYLCNV